MNKTLLKKAVQFLLFFIVIASIPVIFSWIFRPYIGIKPNRIDYWIAMLGITFLGLLFNLIPYRRFTKNRFLKNNSLGYIVILIAFIIILFIGDYNNWYDEKNFGNVKANRSAISTLVSDDESFIKVAFKELEMQFKNPNDFNLRSFMISKKDTILNSGKKTIFSTYFTYYLANNDKTEYEAKVSLYDSLPKLIFFNQPAGVAYYKMYPDEQFGKLDKEAIDSINSAFHKLPDSLQKQFVDTLNALSKKLKKQH